jgi:uncharacterized protein (TIGR01777 family)
MAGFLITGGTGFIGSQLVRGLVSAGHTVVVLTRDPARQKGRYGDQVRYISDFDAIAKNTHFTAVINLAGEGIGDKRWSRVRKQALLDSRVKLTGKLIQLLERLETRPAVMVSGSAVGWYGAHDDAPLTETSAFNPEFTHDLCQAWEDAAGRVKALGIRLCIVRLGIVLGRNGGVLKRLLPPFRFGLGGRIGSGRQVMSWVHLDDVLKAINFLVNRTDLNGVFNLTAPRAVSNADFTRGIGLAISRPTLLPLPGFMVKLLFGEMGDRLLLQGQNVVPARLQAAGFIFDYPVVEEAFADILIR